jgi:hypothetical protein
MTASSPNRPPDPSAQREQALAQIRRLEARAGHGLWALALFLAASIAARFGVARLPSLPPAAREALGAAPSVGLISAALIVYVFSAIILILSRMTLGHPPSAGFLHVAYLAAFYVFYHLAGAAAENFWAVFAAGVTILALCCYHLRSHCQEAIRQERELLATLDRRERFAAGRPLHPEAER